MRLSKQFSIVYYGDQEPLINRNCQNQLMFLHRESMNPFRLSPFDLLGTKTGFKIIFVQLDLI